MEAWSIHRESCRALPTEDHVLAGLAEQSEAPPPQLVQVPSIIPLSGDADLHAGAKVLIRPSRTAVACMRPMTRPPGVQRNSIQEVFPEYLIHSFYMYLQKLYYVPDAGQGGGGLSDEQDRFLPSGSPQMARKIHRMRTDGERTTRRSTGCNEGTYYRGTSHRLRIH